MKKTERLGLVLTVSEKRLVARLAEMEGGLSQSALIRRLILKAAQGYGITTKPEVEKQCDRCGGDCDGSRNL